MNSPDRSAERYHVSFIVGLMAFFLVINQYCQAASSVQRFSPSLLLRTKSGPANGNNQIPRAQH